MKASLKGNLIRINLPDVDDLDHESCHCRHAYLPENSADDAVNLTGDLTDNTGYSVNLSDDTSDETDVEATVVATLGPFQL